jgi:hypothetical protein
VKAHFFEAPDAVSANRPAFDIHYLDTIVTIWESVYGGHRPLSSGRRCEGERGHGGLRDGRGPASCTPPGGKTAPLRRPFRRSRRRQGTRRDQMQGATCASGGRRCGDERMRPDSRRPTQLRPTQLRPTQLRPTQLRPTQLRPTQLRPTQLRSTQIRD